MHPELLSIPYGSETPSFTIATYGALRALGYVAGLTYFLRLSSRDWEPEQQQKLGLGRTTLFAFLSLTFGLFAALVFFKDWRKEPKNLYWLYLWLCPTALWLSVIAGHVAWVLFNRAGTASLGDYFAYWRGGTVLAAEVFGGGVFFMGIAWALKLPLGKLLSPLVQAGLLTFALVKSGCFFAGCCFGARWDGPWAVSFPGQSMASSHHYAEGFLDDPNLPSLAVHPTQIYSVVVFVALFFALRTLLKKGVGAPVDLALLAAAGAFLWDVAASFLRADVGQESTLIVSALLAAVCLGLHGLVQLGVLALPQSTET